ncbi:MAG: HAMP domain-containing sensor histidine kinase [Patescibacteria group bacterium]
MFHSARLKLTAWYLLIIFFISLFFSVTVYQMLTSEVDRFVAMQKAKFERRFMDQDFLPSELRNKLQPPQLMIYIDPDLVNETKGRIALSLIIIDTAILGISGMLAYFLAGKTLVPIANMVDDQQRFVGDASHELRTPLTALKSAIEVNMRDKNLSLDDAKELLINAKDQVDRLTHLSNALLELSTSSSNKNSKKINTFESSNAKKVVENVMSEMKSIADQKNIKITSSPIDLNLQIGERELYRVINILVDNAIKYTKDGGEVQIKLAKNKKSGIIIVNDNGIGISKTDALHIFDRFYRADDARVYATSSSYGLGLSIAKKLVEESRGRIKVTSEVGKGTTFVVHLPLHQNQEQTK